MNQCSVIPPSPDPAIPGSPPAPRAAAPAFWYLKQVADVQVTGASGFWPGPSCGSRFPRSRRGSGAAPARSRCRPPPSSVSAIACGALARQRQPIDDNHGLLRRAFTESAERSAARRILRGMLQRCNPAARAYAPCRRRAIAERAWNPGAHGRSPFCFQGLWPPPLHFAAALGLVGAQARIRRVDTPTPGASGPSRTGASKMAAGNSTFCIFLPFMFTTSTSIVIAPIVVVRIGCGLLLARLADDDDAALGPRHAARDSEQVSFRVHQGHLHAGGGDPVGAHVPGHALAAIHAAGRCRGADRTGRALLGPIGRGSSGRRGSHGASCRPGTPCPWRFADHVDLFADCENIHGDFVAGFRLVDRIRRGIRAGSEAAGARRAADGRSRRR